MTLVDILKIPAKKVLTESQRQAARYLTYGFLFQNDLRKLATVFGTDKEGSHYYAQHYQQHFGQIRKRRLNILEIGIGGYQDPRAGGQSLRMWKAFFPNSHIFGIDIHDKSYHDERRIKTFKGSQVDEEFLRHVVKEIGNVDIIIDDGSHQNEHVIKTFQILFPLLSSNGIYAIEDLQTSYWEYVIGEHWGGSENLNAAHTSMNFLKSLADGLNYEEFTDQAYVPSFFDRHIVSIHFYHNLALIYKGLNNEGSNILKRPSPSDLNEPKRIPESNQ